MKFYWQSGYYTTGFSDYFHSLGSVNGDQVCDLSNH